MLEYKLNKQELENLIHSVYEAANCGYLDLKESSCEVILNDFLKDKEIISNNTNLIVPDDYQSVYVVIDQIEPQNYLPTSI